MAVTTKEKLFDAALDLFTKHGYHTVSMRQLADTVGIQPASIYNHYVSKEALLHHIYQYFDDNMNLLLPDLNVLLELVGKVHPHKIFDRAHFGFPHDIEDNMFQALLITSSLIRVDPLADSLIQKHLINATYDYDIPLLTKMLELDLIEPLDIETFVFVHSAYNHSVAVRSYSWEPESRHWDAGRNMIYEIIKVKNPGQYP